MDILPTDLIYECISFLDWKEYYKLCKHINIELRLSIYFKCNLQKITIDNVCKEKEEYVDVVKFLHSVSASFTYIIDD